MTQHVITKDYQQLRGFSTNSQFKRPAFVADTAVNMMRLPDDSFGTRRGYQAQTSTIGGLGTAVFKNVFNDTIEDLCISWDGNLYKKVKGTVTISFSGSTPKEYVTYEIFVDPTVSSDNQQYRFDPYAVIAPEALVTDSINFRFGKVTSYTGVSIGTGQQTYVGVLPNAPIRPGSIQMTDGTLSVYDEPANTLLATTGTFYGDVGIGANGVDYDSGAFSVTFTGITGAVTASYESDLVTIFNQAMGKGYGVAMPYTIAQLIVQMSAVPGVSISSTGDTNQPGAFLEVTEMTIIPSGKSATLEFYYMVPVNRTLAVTFPGLLASVDTDAYVNATFAAFQEEMYIANKFDPVQKYDGQTCYRAGMPNGAEPATAAGGGGNVDTGDHLYYITYEQIDATGRLVEGVLSDGDSINLGMASEVTVTVDNLVEGTGWNTNCALISGVAGPTNTIPVVAGHTINVNDTAFFIDASGVAQERLVTATTETSITIDGAAVSVTNATEWQTPISNNLRINIYRTKASGTEPFFVFSIPNNSFAATTDYLDNVADSDLNQQYIFPVNRHDPPPQVGVVFPFKNLLIFAVDPFNDDFVWYSDPDQPEYVDQLKDPLNEPNRFIVPANADDVIGVGVAGSTLVIFKTASIYAISGEIATEQFTVTNVAAGSNIGCVAHATIVEIGGVLYFLSGTSGVYAMSETSLIPTDKFGYPVAISTPIDAIFRGNKDQQQLNQQFVLTRAVAVNNNKDNQYILFLPAETPCGCPVNTNPRVANENSRIMMYDYQGKNWFVWTNINAAGGFYVIGDDLFWQERRLSQAGGILANTYKMHRKYQLIDYVDHVTPIRSTWISSWEDYGQPRVRKKFVRAALLFDNVSSRYQTNEPELFFFSCTNWNQDIVSTSTVITTEVEANPWSESEWDWQTWSGYQDTFFTVSLRSGTVAKSIQIGLQLNQLNTTFSLQGFQLEIAPDFGRTIVR